jgi:hypothetical protein
MRFGPRRGWLGEDTLSLDTELGKLQTSFGAWTKVQDLMQKFAKLKEEKSGSSKESEAKPTPRKQKLDRWAGDSQARVS